MSNDENKRVTEKQRHLMEHSLGGKVQTKWYRNHFMASPGHIDLPDLRELEKLEYMIEVRCPSFCPGGILFMVTELGKKFLASDNCPEIGSDKVDYQK